MEEKEMINEEVQAETSENTEPCCEEKIEGENKK